MLPTIGPNEWGPTDAKILSCNCMQVAIATRGDMAHSMLENITVARCCLCDSKLQWLGMACQLRALWVFHLESEAGEEGPNLSQASLKVVNLA